MFLEDFTRDPANALRAAAAHLGLPPPGDASRRAGEAVQRAYAEERPCRLRIADYGAALAALAAAGHHGCDECKAADF